MTYFTIFIIIFSILVMVFSIITIIGNNEIKKDKVDDIKYQQDPQLKLIEERYKENTKEPDIVHINNTPSYLLEYNHQSYDETTNQVDTAYMGGDWNV